MPANSLNSRDLPSMTGMDARPPMFPKTQAPRNHLNTTATILDLFVYLYTFSGSSLYLAARLGYPRCVRRGQVVLVFLLSLCWQPPFSLYALRAFSGTLYNNPFYPRPIYFFQELFSPTILLNTFSVSCCQLRCRRCSSPLRKNWNRSPGLASATERFGIRDRLSVRESGFST